MSDPMDEVASPATLEHFDQTTTDNTPAPVVVEPLPFKDEAVAVLSNAEYAQQTIDAAIAKAESLELPFPLRNAVFTYLDEIDIASSIPGSDGRIRHLVAKIRKIL